MRKRPITSKQFDLPGREIGRVIRLSILNRVLPLGNLQGGPGWRCLLVLGVLHGVGRPFFRLLVRYENQLTSVYRRLRRRGGPDQ